MELDLIKNLACNNCSSLESKIVELNQVITKYEKCQIGLEDVKSRQRYSNNKCGLGFSNFNKPNTSKTIFVKASTKFNNVKPKKVHDVIHSKRSYDRNHYYVFKRNNVLRPTCFYFNTKVHTPSAFYIRNYDVSGEYVWVRKGINP